MGRVRTLLAIASAASGIAFGAELALVHLDAPAPLADSDAIASRMLHPYQYARLRASAAGAALAGAALDPRQERWHLFVPDDCNRERPCGALVWIHPWDEAAPPRSWEPVLRKARVVFVAAARSGNAQPVLDRRVPLALHGLAGAQALVAIDPARVWVGGFSGGGRVASRMAAAFPDVFAGGIFVATADGPGTADSPLPDGARLAALRRGRYWAVVGDTDPENHSILRDAVKHFRRACALAIRFEVETDWGHRMPDGRDLEHAFRFLDRPDPVAPAAREACERAASADADSALAEVDRLLAAGDREGARRALLAAHRDWGGLIAAGFAARWPKVD
jgi:dienelactone hydrolase